MFELENEQYLPFSLQQTERAATLLKQGTLNYEQHKWYHIVVKVQLHFDSPGEQNTGGDVKFVNFTIRVSCRQVRHRAKTRTMQFSHKLTMASTQTVL